MHIPQQNTTNEEWFRFYTQEFEKEPTVCYIRFANHYLCPCCYHPTLSEIGAFEICALCNWEDDGQDDHNADLILGGPNQDYSLTEARANFKQFYTHYRPSDKDHFERTTVKKSSFSNILIDLVGIKKQMMEKLDQMLTMSNPSEQSRLLREAKQLEDQLW